MDNKIFETLTREDIETIEATKNILHRVCFFSEYDSLRERIEEFCTIEHLANEIGYLTKILKNIDDDEEKVKVRKWMEETYEKLWENIRPETRMYLIEFINLSQITIPSEPNKNKEDILEELKENLIINFVNNTITITDFGVGFLKWIKNNT